jgi:hypothetical protein
MEFGNVDPENPEQILSRRAEQIALWLKDNTPVCQEEQKHPDPDTPELVYWHYGYLRAIRDALNFLN